MRTALCFGTIAVLVVSAFIPASAQDWPRFRGPNGSGVSEAQGIPTQWTEQDYAWTVTLPGVGISSPVVWRDKLFVTSGDEDTGARIVLCLDATSGEIRWSKPYPAARHKKHLRNSFATSTPAVDERHVYVCWGTPEEFKLLALDHAGNEVWQKDLGPYAGGHGSGTSPIVYEDLVVLAMDQDRQSFLIAVERLTGQTRWKVDRRGRRAGYSTPCVYQPAGGPASLIFTDWQQGITAIDPLDGRLQWEIDVFGQDQQKRAVGSPVVAGDLVIGSAGFTGGHKYVAAVRPPGSAATSSAEAELVYRLERNVPHLPTPLVKDGLLFLWADNGIVTCVDVADGKQRWQQRIGNNYAGSPVCVGGHLYAIAEDGEVVVLAAQDTFQLVSRNQLGEASRSTPAVANNTLYLRTFSRIFALRGK